MAARRKSQLKAFETSILEALDQVERATSKLFKLEDILEAVCRNILALGFDFANISLISLEKNIIEGVHGSGAGVVWANLAKHYLEPDPELRDIQADIVQTQQTEIISGWDKRFDRWIYQEYGHEKLVRVFTPIVLVQDYNGKVIKNWFERCKWEKINPQFEESRKRQHEVYQLRLAPDLQPEGRNPEVIVIGTVEAGYSSPERRIEEKTLSRFLDYIARQSLDIWQAQLPRVLETIAEKAKQILNADAATLHFLYEPNLEQGRYIYEVFSHGIGKQFLKACPPRHNGLGRQAILERKYKFIPDLSQGHDKLEMATLNPQAFSAGIKAMAAFPLQVENKEGILYVLFRRTYILSTRKLRLVELFVRQWAVDAIWHPIRIQQMRDEARQLAALYSVTQSLGRIPEDNLLHRVAWNTLNVLGADVVNIYEYIQTERQFTTPPKTAGRLRQEQKMQDEIIEHDVPFLLIQRGENVYAPQLEKEPIFQNSAFTRREKIHSAAGVLLEVDKDIVGVMFINYRRPHSFSEDEKKMIETLASSAAIAIKNQRWLATLSDIDRKIITTLDQKELLNLIVQRAVQICGADVGNLRLLDLSQQELVTKAKYAVHETIELIERRNSINEGITGWVARNGQSALVNNVLIDSRYQADFANIHSELCVPLLDDKRLLGVLNVESQHLSAFNQRHQRMLEALADQAVIGIQNLENKRQLVNMETMATLGDLAGPLVHRMNNDVGAIRVWAQDILDEGDENSKSRAQRISSRADRVLQGADRMKIWIQEKPHAINLSEIVVNALARMSIPANIIPNIEVSSDLPKVLGGEQQLIYVFDNLIQNAVEAMPQGGRVSIVGTNVQREIQCWVEVQICDTGVGIAAENWEKIFQPDYTTKTARRGMGFGLWWTKLYVERLGGYLSVNSVLNQGTNFTMLLPIYKPET
ncbi:MAG: GAF domain-containing protein [Aulosira sp. ZfuVER01]|nr:GAF domain-containing protein [Aulosira sp. ZfuVER01]MDZ8002064.1 GAF domain-containing protein [Aulosira sp. DedVER01a]MDZ8056284.1 GAF domain-containing protein [Aulosira sp. ZfuCHP01]